MSIKLPTDTKCHCVFRKTNKEFDNPHTRFFQAVVLLKLKICVLPFCLRSRCIFKQLF